MSGRQALADVADLVETGRGPSADDNWLHLAMHTPGWSRGRSARPESSSSTVAAMAGLLVGTLTATTDLAWRGASTADHLVRVRSEALAGLSPARLADLEETVAAALELLSRLDHEREVIARWERAHGTIEEQEMAPFEEAIAAADAAARRHAAKDAFASTLPTSE